VSETKPDRPAPLDKQIRDQRRVRQLDAGKFGVGVALGLCGLIEAGFYLAGAPIHAPAHLAILAVSGLAGGVANIWHAKRSED